MKNLMFSGVLAACFLLLGTQSGFAQKFGYLNSAFIVMELPETRVADSLLQQFQDSLVQIGEEQAKQLQEEYAQYVQDAQAGLLTRKEMEAKEQKLQAGQEELQEFEEVTVRKIQAKQKEMYEPILQRVQAAIEAVGKENGYQFIFDVSSGNTLLYADETMDVTELVREKLK
jgi:outer membrane protein